MKYYDRNFLGCAGIVGIIINLCSWVYVCNRGFIKLNSIIYSRLSKNEEPEKTIKESEEIYQQIEKEKNKGNKRKRKYKHKTNNKTRIKKKIKILFIQIFPPSSKI